MIDRQQPFQNADAPIQAWNHLADHGSYDGREPGRTAAPTGSGDGALAESIRRLVDGAQIPTPAGQSDRARRKTDDPMDIYDRIVLEDFVRRSAPPRRQRTSTAVLAVTTIVVFGVIGLLATFGRPARVAPPAFDATPVGIDWPFP
jgi:hypothetical protein